jgi:hypothetical protein
LIEKWKAKNGRKANSFFRQRSQHTNKTRKNLTCAVIDKIWCTDLTKFSPQFSKFKCWPIFFFPCKRLLRLFTPL